MSDEKRDPNTVYLGWGAEPLKEQHPVLPDIDAEHFDRDNQDLHRLVIRGIIARSEADRARSRLTKQIGEAIQRALSENA